MDDSFTNLEKEFEEKIKLIGEHFDRLKSITRSMVDKLRVENENNNKIVETFKKYESIESDIVRLNVGGTLYSTLKSTLTKKIKNPLTNEFFKPNVLEGLVEGYIEPKYDDNRAIFIDRNSKYFQYILDYLRMANSENEFEIPDNVDRKDLRKEAKFYNIEGLIDLIDTKSIKSSILKGSQFKELLSLCGFPENERWILIYKGSRDGFSSRNFHSKCDNVSKTLTIIRTNNGNIFGGYTESVWNNGGLYRSDHHAFLFSFVNKKNNPIKLKISHGYETYAIYCSANTGPTFGGGHDLYISDNSNTNNTSYANIGHSYRHSNLVYGTTEANNLMADSYNFQVEEIEVFARKLI